MVHASIVSNKKDVDEANEILYEVFIKEKNYREEDVLNCFYNTDAQIFHVLIYEGIKKEHPVAYGRIIIDKAGIGRIFPIAVKMEYRGNGYGDLAVRMLVDKAISLSCNNILTYIPKNLIPMFEKIGFYNIEQHNNENIENICTINRTYKYICLKYDTNKVDLCQNKHQNLE